MKTIDSFFDAATSNLRSSQNWEPYARLMPGVHDLYRGAINLVPSNQPPVFGQCLLLSHRSYLSAAMLIGQALPFEAAPLTRRAIEVARLAALAKSDPQNLVKWNSFEEREQRWKERQDGRRPKPIQPKYGRPHPQIADAIDELMRTHGILSDVGAHFTPEFAMTASWQNRDDGAFLDYFTGDNDELLLQVVTTTGTHLRILNVLNWCLSGAFSLDRHWQQKAETYLNMAKPYAATFDNTAP